MINYNKCNVINGPNTVINTIYIVLIMNALINNMCTVINGNTYNVINDKTHINNNDNVFNDSIQY